MSRILVATQVPKGREWFGDPVTWEVFCRIVRDELDKGIVTVEARGKDPGVSNYVVIRTSNSTYGKLKIATPTDRYLSEHPKGGDPSLVDGDSALIDMLGYSAQWSSGRDSDYARGFREQQHDAHIKQRLYWIFERVRSAINDQFHHRLEATLDMTLVTEPAELLKPESDEHFYLHGSEVFVREYLESLPPGGGWRRTVL